MHNKQQQQQQNNNNKTKKHLHPSLATSLCCYCPFKIVDILTGQLEIIENTISHFCLLEVI
jgi:hypothetical protein